jgi:hypothetical protein
MRKLLKGIFRLLMQSLMEDNEVFMVTRESFSVYRVTFTNEVKVEECQGKEARA